MKTLRLSLIAAGLALAFAAQAQTTPGSRIEQRFTSFAGSGENAGSLVTGLRTGSEITLTGEGETITFTSPTKPMGYGNVTRSLDLAQRQLAANGISDPTPTELHIALTGGSIDGVNYQGVLQMRADGMGWGQIAHQIGVHPGLGKPVATQSVPATSTTSTTGSARGGSGIVTAGSGSPFAHGNSQGRALGASKRASATTGSGPSANAAGGASAGGNGAIRAATGGGNGQGNAFGRSK